MNLPRSGDAMFITPGSRSGSVDSMEPDIGSESRFLPTPPAFDAHVEGGGLPLEYCHDVGLEKLWCGYPMVKNFEAVYSQHKMVLFIWQPVAGLV